MKISYHAFSLVEVLVVIVLLSMAAAAFRATGMTQMFRSWSLEHTLSEQSQTLLRGIERARTLAISSGQSVMLCGGRACNGAWSDALYLTYATGGTPLWRKEFAAQTRINWQGFPQQRDYIEFLPTGLASYQNGSFYICLEQSHAQRVIINQSGRAYLDAPNYAAKECL
ncbi:GspH/FimT family protein [Marinomonas ostreistagni]|uniref:GspH/FimT family protein n=1 Tax=Marinomonas ostreistagni TaxID=359209 RepID=UPI00194DE54B|nr:GspH/FimT family protein [Marinomonas ostreistagni]MBM6549672.1 GspH/FimT family protein [Marinomonas ostreistagni]